MRTILFFDLPVVKEKQRKAYAKFVKTIKKQGFYMMQESVYIKLNLDERSADSSIKQVKEILPPEGCVAALKVTEKQFASMEFLLGGFESDVLTDNERTVII